MRYRHPKTLREVDVGDDTKLCRMYERHGWVPFLNREDIDQGLGLAAKGIKIMDGVIGMLKNEQEK